MSTTANQQDEAKQVVRVDQDSETDLQALFDSVLKPDSKRPQQVPWSKRKLPDSFFNPPSTGSKSINHSRENSVDSAFGSSSSVPTSNAASTSPPTIPPPPPPPLQAAHHRAHSSPASLQQTYVLGQQPPPIGGGGGGTSAGAHLHIKQRSYDVATKQQAVNAILSGRDILDNTPLPPGWEQARTPEGQLYFLNHITRTTTWEDPRKSLAAQVAVQHQSAEQLLTTSATGSSSSSVKATDVELGPLPDGWEQAQTPEGETYFINHQTRTTSWFDPRIPSHLQQRSPNAAGSGPLIGHSWSSSSLSQSSPAKQQQFRLQLLQIERDRLKLRQQEIRRQQELMMRGSNGDLPMDPFLTSLNDHSRQESTDSGLGLGTNYSMPHTPEDFLSNIDNNMEVGSDTHTMGGTPDISLSDNIDCTEDLVPSLQLGEEFLIINNAFL